MQGEIKQRSPGSWQIRVFLGRDENGKRIRKNEVEVGERRPQRAKAPGRDLLGCPQVRCDHENSENGQWP